MCRKICVWSIVVYAKKNNFQSLSLKLKWKNMIILLLTSNLLSENQWSNYYFLSIFEANRVWLWKPLLHEFKKLSTILQKPSFLESFSLDSCILVKYLVHKVCFANCWVIVVKFPKIVRYGVFQAIFILFRF